VKKCRALVLTRVVASSGDSVKAAVQYDQPPFRRRRESHAETRCRWVRSLIQSAPVIVNTSRDASLRATSRRPS
jgi:hypothetical protein